MTLKELLDAISSCGGLIEVKDGSPRLVAPEEPYFRGVLMELLPEMKARRDDILDYFAGGERTRRRAEIHRMCEDADGRCAAAGGLGDDPDVSRAAEVVAAAVATDDPETVWRAVVEFDLALTTAITRMKADIVRPLSCTERRGGDGL